MLSGRNELGGVGRGPARILPKIEGDRVIGMRFRARRTPGFELTDEMIVLFEQYTPEYIEARSDDPSQRVAWRSPERVLMM